MVKSESLIGKNERNAEIITIVSGKGGTGKTIILSSLAHILADIKKRVLVIDCDFGTKGLSLFLLKGERRTYSLGLYEYITNDGYSPEAIEPVELEEEFYGIHLVPAFQNLSEYFSDESIQRSKYYNKIKEIIEHFRTEYDYIFFDTRGGADFKTAIPALLSDQYIVISEQDPLSWKVSTNIYQAVQQDEVYRDSETRDEIETDKSNWGTRIPSFILNKAVFDNQYLRGLADSLSNNLGGATSLGYLRLDEKAVEAFQKGVVPIHYAPDCDFAYGIIQIAKNLFNPSSAWARTDPARSLFDQLKDEIETAYAQNARKAGGVDFSYRYRLGLLAAMLFFPLLSSLKLGYTFEGLNIIFFVFVAAFVLSVVVSDFKSILARFRFERQSRLKFDTSGDMTDSSTRLGLTPEMNQIGVSTIYTVIALIALVLGGRYLYTSVVEYQTVNDINAEYKAIAGTLNTQISNLEKAKTGFEIQIASQKNNLAKLEREKDSSTQVINSQKETIDELQKELNALQARPAFSSDYKIGIYYLEDDTKNKQLAQTIRAILEENGYPRIAYYEKNRKDKEFFNRAFIPAQKTIRYQGEKELKVAERLKEILDGTSQTVELELTEVNTETPNFISIFLIDSETIEPSSMKMKK